MTPADPKPTSEAGGPEPPAGKPINPYRDNMLPASFVPHIAETDVSSVREMMARAFDLGVKRGSASRDAEVAALRVEIANLKAELEEAAGLYGECDALLKEKEATIASLEAELHDSRMRHAETCGERDRLLDHQRIEGAKHVENYNELVTAISAKEAEIARLRDLHEQALQVVEFSEGAAYVSDIRAKISRAQAEDAAPSCDCRCMWCLQGKHEICGMACPLAPPLVTAEDAAPADGRGKSE